MTRARRAALSLGGAVALLTVAATAPAQLALDDLLLPPMISYLVRPGINPPNLAENIEGFAKALCDMGNYDAATRAKGMNAKREEALRAFESSFNQDRELMTMYLAWLQDAVERAPVPGSGLKEDDVAWDVVETSRKEFTKRKPVASDFRPRKKEVPEHERGENAKLKPGDLEFK